MNDNYMDALAVYAGADNYYGCGCDGDGKITNLDWHSDNPKAKPTTAELDIIISSLKTEYTRLEYARKRKAEYDQLNQLELISDDSINGTTTHKDAILAIKAKFPKPA